MHKVHIPGRNFKPDELAEAREPSPEPRLLGPIAAEIVADLTFRRRVTRLHERGPRVVAEFLAELGADRLITTIIDQMLDRYLGLADEALDATGARDFPPQPFHEVRR